MGKESQVWVHACSLKIMNSSLVLAIRHLQDFPELQKEERWYGEETRGERRGEEGRKEKRRGEAGKEPWWTDFSKVIQMDNRQMKTHSVVIRKCYLKPSCGNTSHLLEELLSKLNIEEDAEKIKFLHCWQEWKNKIAIIGKWCRSHLNFFAYCSDNI